MNGWEGANKPEFLGLPGVCDVCGSEETEVRVIHKGEEHWVVCKECSQLSMFEEFWGCGCGG